MVCRATVWRLCVLPVPADSKLVIGVNVSMNGFLCWPCDGPVQDVQLGYAEICKNLFIHFSKRHLYEVILTNYVQAQASLCSVCIFWTNLCKGVSLLARDMFVYSAISSYTTHLSD